MTSTARPDRSRPDRSRPGPEPREQHDPDGADRDGAGPLGPLPIVVHHVVRAGSSISISVDADRATVFAHLSDPRTYPAWLTGAQAICAVDDDWPAVGSSFAHRVGVGPVQVHDRTTVVAIDAPDELVLHAAIGPIGSANVRFRLFGSNPTEVVFEESPATGTIRLASLTLGRLLLRTSIWGRNRVSLERLKQLIENPDRAA